jgi:hypothetical protein
MKILALVDRSEEAGSPSQDINEYWVRAQQTDISESS